MSTVYKRPTLVVHIKREYFAAILSLPRRKDIEFRTASGHWLRRLENVGPAPFDLRILNGMTPPVSEATVRVLKVVKRNAQLLLHLGQVLKVKHWD